jgi:hypothetical protein
MIVSNHVFRLDKSNSLLNELPRAQSSSTTNNDDLLVIFTVVSRIFAEQTTDNGINLWRALTTSETKPDGTLHHSTVSYRPDIGLQWDHLSAAIHWRVSTNTYCRRRARKWNHRPTTPRLGAQGSTLRYLGAPYWNMTALMRTGAIGKNKIKQKQKSDFAGRTWR